MDAMTYWLNKLNKDPESVLIPKRITTLQILMQGMSYIQKHDCTLKEHNKQRTDK